MNIILFCITNKLKGYVSSIKQFFIEKRKEKKIKNLRLNEFSQKKFQYTIK